MYKNESIIHINRSGDFKIKKYVLYGERHSGTTWINKSIQYKLDVVPSYDYGHKHFFLQQSWERLNSAHDVLFIAVVREIYNWIGAMHKHPHHLCYYAKSIEDLLFNPVISKDKHKKEIQDKNHINNKNHKNLLELRTTKLKYLYYYMPILVDNYVLIQYENFCKKPIETLKRIAKTFDIKYLNNDKNVIGKPHPKYDLPTNIISYLDDNVKWEYEQLFGYVSKSFSGEK
jgi:hypothetical protein